MADKRKRGRGQLVLLLVTLLSGTAAAVLGYAYIEKRLADERAAHAGGQVRVVETPELLSVVVVRRDVYRGERLTADDLTLLSVPTEGVSVGGVLADPQQAIGHVALQNLYAGEWLIARKLAASDTEGDTWNRLLMPGRRAIRVPATGVTGLLGFLQPDDRVDVIGVFTTANKQMVSRTLEQNVAVLAVGQRHRPDAAGPGESAPQESTIMLDVSQPQAERIALALEVGKLQLVLRNRADERIVTTGGADVAELSRGQVVAAPVRPSAPRHVVQVLSGGRVSSEVVNR